MSFRNEKRIPMDVQQEDRSTESLATPVDLAIEGSRPSHRQQRDGHAERPPSEQIFDAEFIRETIMEHERVFREQVRELHRVHRVQTILMAEMSNRERERDLASRSLLSNIGIHSLSSSVSVSSGRWNRPGGDLPPYGGNYCDITVALPEATRITTSLAQSKPSTLRPSEEENMFRRSVQATPLRKTFDLERPPEDEDDEQMGCRDDEISRAGKKCIPFMGSPAMARSDPESELSLNLSSDWSQGKVVNDDKGNFTKMDIELKSTKRPREEAALIPFLPTKSENLRDASIYQMPTATPSSALLGGPWGLQLGHPSSADSVIPADDGGVVKKERRSLNLELEKVLPGTPINGAPHWLPKAPSANPPKKDVCQTEIAGLSLQHPVSPPRDRSMQGMMEPGPFRRSVDSGLDLTPELVWDGDRRTSDTPASSRSQFSSNVRGMSEEDVHQARLARSRSAGAGAMKGPLKNSSKPVDAPGEFPGYSPWKESENSCRGTSYKFGSNHPLAGGFGPKTRDCDGYRGLPSPGLVHVGPTVHFGVKSAAFGPNPSPAVWNQRRVLNSPIHQYEEQHERPALHNESFGSCRPPWQVPMQISQGVAPSCPGALYVRSTPISSVLHSSDALQKLGNHVPSSQWNREVEPPPFAPISIVTPPKPPFKRPPRLVLTHDGASTELKLVSPSTQLSTKVAEKEISGSSDEDLTGKGCKRGGDDVDHGRVEDGSDTTLHSGGRPERDTRAGMSGWLKDKVAGAGAVSFAMANSRPPGSEPEVFRAGRKHFSQQHSPGVFVTNSHEGTDDADRGSSDGGSGGYGVGDVINPGDRGSPSLGTLSIGESNRYLPAGEGEEGVNMGEIGLEADSESQSSIDRKAVQVKKPRKHTEELISQEAMFTSANYGNHPPRTATMIGRETTDRSSFNFEKRTPGRYSNSSFTPDEEERSAVFHHHGFDHSCTSGPTKGFYENGDRAHGLFPDRQGPVEFRMTHLEHDQSFGSPRGIHASKTTAYQVKEGSKLSAPFSPSQGSMLMREVQGGRLVTDVEDMGSKHAKLEQRNLLISDFVDVCKQEREIKAFRNNQLSGPIVAEKDVQRKPYSPVLRHIPSPSSTVNLARHAEGSSMKVSQASETVQGNERSPLRGSRWIGPTSMDQDRCYYPGAIGTYEETDGTLVKGYQQGILNGKDLSLGRGCVPSSITQKELGRTASGMVVTNPSFCGSKGISTATNAPQFAKDAGVS